MRIWWFKGFGGLWRIYMDFWGLGGISSDNPPNLSSRLSVSTLGLDPRLGLGVDSRSRSRLSTFFHSRTSLLCCLLQTPNISHFRPIYKKFKKMFDSETIQFLFYSHTKYVVLNLALEGWALIFCNFGFRI